MRINNKTHLDTSNLRRVFQEVLTLDNKYESPKIRSKDLMIEVIYGRNGWLSGRAWIGLVPRWRRSRNGKYKRLPNITIIIPSKKHFKMVIHGYKTDQQVLERQNVDWTLAFVFLHELQHTRGYKHRKINDKNLKKLVEHIKYGNIHLN